MKSKIVKSSELEWYDIGEVHKGANYIDDESLPELSIVQINRLQEKESGLAEKNMFYYVLEGTGEFELNGTKQILTVGDMLVVARGDSYNTPANVKLLVACTPRFGN
ncbi:MAG: hypothetical protein OXR68_03795 [Alphaproteobacteria bacterium]|nr:hypothetical protein [Alphaproteobacteria bacterium]MDD9919728.1 hypothetical protein [Alphaproteobacteria bacterium]